METLTTDVPKLSSLEGEEADGKEVHPSVVLDWQGEEVIMQSSQNPSYHRMRPHSYINAAAIFAHALQLPASLLQLATVKVSKHLLVTKEYHLFSILLGK